MERRPGRRRSERLATPPVERTVRVPKKMMLVNAREPGEVRVAVIENGALCDIFVERGSRRRMAGNIYVGRVVNVESSLQAAFVDLGSDRNGFLHASDVLPPDGGFHALMRKPARGAGVGADAPAAGHEVAGSTGEPDAGRARPPGSPAAGQSAPHVGRETAGAAAGGESAARDAAPCSGALPPAMEGSAAAPVISARGEASERRGRRRRRRPGKDARPQGIVSSEPPPVPPAPHDPTGGPAGPAGGDVPAPAPVIGGGGGGSGHGRARRRRGRRLAPGERTGEASTSGRLPVSSEQRAIEAPSFPPPPISGAAGASIAAGGAPATAAAGGGSIHIHSDGAPMPRPEGDAGRSGAAGSPHPAAARGLPPGGGGSGREERRAQRRNGEPRAERRMLIQEMLKAGQKLLVQVTKEGIGTKGPSLTTYIGIPGRHLVLMPAVNRLGISKRIEDDAKRQEMKRLMERLNPPPDMGVILRTAAQAESEAEIKRDLDSLLALWENIKKKAMSVKAPALVYSESDLVVRVMRDALTDDVEEIVLDTVEAMEEARDFLSATSPALASRLILYRDEEPLFHRYGVEDQIQKLFNRKVNLPSGGSIVIEQTEALVAIDVNTGRFRERRDMDQTILETNLEAAREIARQLRLRDVGGLVMIDFIDMESPEHRRKVERELKAALAKDKARITVLPISRLGVVEMTRQRVRPSLKRTLFDKCPTCGGSGMVKSDESVALDALREIRRASRVAGVSRIQVGLSPSCAQTLQNRFRAGIAELEAKTGITVEIVADPTLLIGQIRVSAAKGNGETALQKISEVEEYVRSG
ncbi:MAG: Rne/Rng family ribonuclease [Planctomycetota bacterium]|nr:Rne/Rng family ribonuclease [Planctomycetota bacterium]